ncbi:MAG: replicative DNA helicase [Kiloniellales bacterium]
MASTQSNDSAVRRLDGKQAEAQYRVPPHNYEAEQALLGAILANNRAYEKVSEFLAPEHFADPLLGRIYEACGKLIERGQLADVLTLKPLFEQDSALEEAGGGQFLVRLAGSVVTVINAEDYGRTIHDHHLRRQLIDIGEAVVNDAYSLEVDSPAVQQIEATEQKLYDLATEGRHEGGFESFDSAMMGALEMAELAFRKDSHVSGISTGLRDLDSWLGGLQPSDLVVLAGRPGMGKTALATNIAFNAAHAAKTSDGREGAAVGFFSLEMSAEQLATRILAERAEVSSDEIRRGAIRSQQFDQIVLASQEISRLPLFIDDTPALTVAGLRTRARRLKRQHDLGLIVVDYLQLVLGSRAARNESRVQEISEITRGLKTLAKELDVPVLALSQLSRAVEQRDDKHPQLADLRESGTIEQDADVVMFIYREEYYERQKQPREGTPDHDAWQKRMAKVHNQAEIVIAKQRHGPTGKVDLYFDGQYTRFRNLQKAHRSDAAH